MIRWTEAPTETALVGLDTVKAELGISGDDLDDLLTRRIDAISTGFANACGRIGFGLGTVEETIVAPVPRGALWLWHWPVVSIASIVEDGVTLTSDQWELENGRKLWRLDGECRLRFRPRLIVTYQGGYGLPTACPPDLADKALTMIRSAWLSRDRDPMLKAETIPDVASFEYWVGEVNSASAGSFPADVDAVLMNYRNKFFG